MIMAPDYQNPSGPRKLSRGAAFVYTPARGKTAMFVWIFHRISGLLLILLLGIKLLTALFLMTRGKKPDWALALHTNALVDVLLIVLLVTHALYGLRTVILDLGVRREKTLFWVFTVLGFVLSAVLLALYFTRDY
jgi:succinate dehydrogenase/fumarate reductase cytochrome b subunit